MERLFWLLYLDTVSSRERARKRKIQEKNVVDCHKLTVIEKRPSEKDGEPKRQRGIKYKNETDKWTMPLMITDLCTKKPVAHIWNFMLPFFVCVCVCLSRFSIHTNPGSHSHAFRMASVYLLARSGVICVGACVCVCYTDDGDVDDDLVDAYAHAHSIQSITIVIKQRIEWENRV